MNKKGILGALALCAMLSLSACGDPAQSNTSLEQIEKTHPTIIQNEGDPTGANLLKVAQVDQGGFKGVFSPVFYTDGNDSAVMENTMCGAFPTDDEFRLIQDSDKTPINMHIDRANSTVTYKINPKFKWNDGTPVTTDDIIKTYEIVANNDFIMSAQSPRFTEDMHIIKGIVDYNEGKAKTISGLEKISDSEMKIHFTHLTPGVIYGGATLGEFVKASDFKDVPMDKIINCDAVRKNPASYGPYVIKNIVAGERVDFVANPYYYKGEAKVKKVRIEVLPSSQQVADMQTGGHDIYLQTSPDAYDEMAALTNIKMASRPDLYVSYFGFKLGKWDASTNSVVPDPDAKMANPALRQAMGYAIDNATVDEKFFSSLRFLAQSPIPPVFKKFNTGAFGAYNFDMPKAQKLLDDAGFKDVDGDGFRENPDGSKLVINFAMMGGTETDDATSEYYLQQWGKGEDGTGKNGLGLNVQLVDGRLLDFKNFYDRMDSDDPKIDIYKAGAGWGSDPNPTGYFGEHAAMNYSRFITPDVKAALDKINSEEALDPNKCKQFYDEFEKAAKAEASFIPMNNRVVLLPVNNRVKYYDFGWGNRGFDWSQIELTADQPIAD